MGLLDNIGGAATAASAAALKAAGDWLVKSDDDVSFTDMQSALVKAGMAEPTEEKPRGLFHDPYSIMDWGGWRQRPSALTYDTLRQMTLANTVIAAIIQLRTNQVAQFCRPQQGPYDKGYRIILRDRRDKNRAMSKAEILRATELERMLETTGYLLPTERAADRDSFKAFTKKFVRDTLTYDQGCFEKIRDRRQRVSRFIMLPSETIRLAVADVEHMDPVERMNRVAYVQVYEDTIIAEFAPDDLAWCIMNPRSDLRVNGFGFAPVEQIIRLVTAWLFGFDYNQKFFCVTGDTLVATDRGVVPIANLPLDGERFRVWNGRDWREARAYETGRKPVVRTKLWNGIELRTSPEHLFRVIPRESGDGEPVWRRQCELKRGDWALVGYRREDCALDEESFHVGRTYEGRAPGPSWTVTAGIVRDPEFWEMVGFALGDGYWPDVRKRGPGHLSIFPHHTREAALFARFEAVFARHGIPCRRAEVNPSHRRPDGEYGYPCLVFYKAFSEWLTDLGFRPSSEGRRVPAVIFGAPAWLRSAVMRGLFTADGHTRTHATGYRTPTVCAVDPVFRQDILRCLWSLGVATNEVGVGWSRDASLSVQDVRAFVEHVGYLDDYKNEGIELSDRSATRWDRVHPALGRVLAERVRESGGWLALDVADRGLLSLVIDGKSNISRPRLRRLCRQAGVAEPAALAYAQVPVDVLDLEPAGEEPMFDVEVLDDEHVFLANGVAVHNTQGSAIKGVINVKGAIPDRQLRAFRRMWYTMVSGVQNAWRTPILNSEDIQWINMHSTNREMEFSGWMDWLTKLICAVYGIDPVEINFIFQSGGRNGSMFAHRPNQAEVTESKDKGLRPLVDHIADSINIHIIQELEPDFEFAFTGLDAKAEDKEREARLQEVTKYKTVDQIRAEMDDPPLPNGQGEIILDPTYLQFALQKMQQQQQPPPEGGGEDETLLMPGQQEPQEQPGEGGEGEKLEASLRFVEDVLQKAHRTETIRAGQRVIGVDLEQE